MKTVTLLLLITATITNNFNIAVNCTTCSSKTLGINCLKLYGGPFSNYEQSIDAQYSSCKKFQTAKQLPSSSFIATYICGEGCPNCALSLTVSGSIIQTQCQESVSSQLIVQVLNEAYIAFQADPLATYNWCDKACSTNSSQTGLVVGLVLGGVVAIAIVIGLFQYCQNKKFEISPYEKV